MEYRRYSYAIDPSLNQHCFLTLSHPPGSLRWHSSFALTYLRKWRQIDSWASVDPSNACVHYAITCIDQKRHSHVNIRRISDIDITDE